jgi:hypothetical protein
MRQANRPITDENNVAELTLKSVEFKKFNDLTKVKAGLPPEQCEWEGYQLEFTVPGISGEFRFPERVGAVINKDPVETKYRGKQKIYNRLTTLLIRTGLVDEQKIGEADPDTIHEKFVGLSGTVYKAKLVRVDGFHRIDLNTISPT